MSAPTFHATALCTNSERETWSSPQVNSPLTHMPGVAGAFVSHFGLGGRRLTGQGYYEASSTTGALAAKALKGNIRTLQEALLNRTDSYVGADGVTYTSCILTRLGPIGEIQIQGASTSWTARVMMGWEVVELDPLA